MHHRTEGKMPGSVNIAGLDPPARGGNETVGRDRLGPLFRCRPVPMGQARLDRAALSRRQRRGGQVPVFVEPCHHLAVG